MVQIETRAGGGKPTVLTGEAISREDIRAAEANLPPGNAVKGREHDHARNRNRTTGRTNPFRVRTSAPRLPAVKIEGLVRGIHRTGAPAVQERKSATDRGDVDRKKRTIQDQDTRVQHLVPREILPECSKAINETRPQYSPPERRIRPHREFADRVEPSSREPERPREGTLFAMR